jgi:hypothetical protein
VSGRRQGGTLRNGRRAASRGCAGVRVRQVGVRVVEADVRADTRVPPARPLPSRTHRTRRPGGAGVGHWWSVVRSPRPGDLGLELLIAVRTGNVMPQRGADEPTIRRPLRLPPLWKALPDSHVQGVIQGTRQPEGQVDVVLTPSFPMGLPSVGVAMV